LAIEKTARSRKKDGRIKGIGRLKSDWAGKGAPPNGASRIGHEKGCNVEKNKRYGKKKVLTETGPGGENEGSTQVLIGQVLSGKRGRRVGEGNGWYTRHFLHKKGGRTSPDPEKGKGDGSRQGRKKNVRGVRWPGEDGRQSKKVR